MIEASLRNRMPVPESIQNAPSLFMGLELFLTGFMELNDERAIGWDSGPIPWRAMLEYCRYSEISGEQRDDFFYHVKRLDLAYLNWKAEKQERDKPRPPE